MAGLFCLVAILSSVNPAFLLKSVIFPLWTEKYIYLPGL